MGGARSGGAYAPARPDADADQCADRGRPRLAAIPLPGRAGILCRGRHSDRQRARAAPGRPGRRARPQQRPDEDDPHRQSEPAEPAALQARARRIHDPRRQRRPGRAGLPVAGARRRHQGHADAGGAGPAAAPLPGLVCQCLGGSAHRTAHLLCLHRGAGSRAALLARASAVHPAAGEQRRRRKRRSPIRPSRP